MWWAHTHIKDLTLHSQRPKILAVSAARTLPKSPRSARGYWLLGLGAGDLLLVLISVCVKDDLHWQYWPPLKPGGGEGREKTTLKKLG